MQFKRGDHICVFYRDEQTLIDTLARYIADGLARRERCFCAQKPHVIPLLFKALEKLGVDIAAEGTRAALEIHKEEDVYFANGRFEPESMMARLERSIDESLDRGFSGFRTAGEMSWALDTRHGTPAVLCDQLAGYEEMVQATFPGKAAIGLCQYPMRAFPPATLDRVLEAHHIALEETMVSTNHSTLTIRAGDYAADIVADRIHPGESFHYVIQQKGSREILSWGMEPSMDAAIGSVKAELSTLAGKKRYSAPQ
jgi:hypothetical protein